MIYREFFTSEDVTSLPAVARILFAGMIVFADDKGLIRHSQRFYKGTILQGLHLGRLSIQRCLDLMEGLRMVCPCVVDDVKHYRITNFARFQRLTERNETKGRERELEANGTRVRAADVRGCEGGSGNGNPEAYLAMLHEWGCQAGDVEQVRRMLETTGGGSDEDVAAWREFHKLAGKQKSVRDASAFTRLKAIRLPHPDAAGVEFWKAAQRERESELEKAKVQRAPPEQRARLQRAEAEPAPIGNVLEEFKRRKRKAVQDKPTKEEA